MLCAEDDVDDDNLILFTYLAAVRVRVVVGQNLNELVAHSNELGTSFDWVAS